MTTEITAAMMVAPNTRERVTETRLVTPVATSWPLNHERPRSPVRAWVSQSQYWTTSGRSRPNWEAFSVTWAWLAVGPTMRRAMSPPPAYSSK